eukprot:GHVL01037771.1.p2 GENE.GHVL01037771.1~~GHVL01037771.1.p2  ORF type:complete len:126 (+),score=13.17 GHVL01037771.1:274-651(+)
MDDNGDHPLLVLLLQSAGPGALLPQVVPVHILHHSLPHRCDGRGDDHLPGPTPCVGVRHVLCVAAQHCKHLVQLLLLPVFHHLLLPARLPPAVRPHAGTTEEDNLQPPASQEGMNKFFVDAWRML